MMKLSHVSSSVNSDKGNVESDPIGSLIDGLEALAREGSKHPLRTVCIGGLLSLLTVANADVTEDTLKIESYTDFNWTKFFETAPSVVQHSVRTCFVPT